jgi:hypothetical protein
MECEAQLMRQVTGRRTDCHSSNAETDAQLCLSYVAWHGMQNHVTYNISPLHAPLLHRAVHSVTFPKNDLFPS